MPKNRDTSNKIADNVSGGSAVLIECAERYEELAQELRAMAARLDEIATQ